MMAKPTGRKSDPKVAVTDNNEELDKLSSEYGKIRDQADKKELRNQIAQDKYKATIQKFAISDEEKQMQLRQEILETKMYYAKKVKVPWCLLMPDSRMMQRWDMVTLIALLFTAVVTPYEVALLETQIDGLFFINRLIDVIFITDLVANFFLAYREESKEGHGRLIKNFNAIRWNYLSTWFFLDLISCAPFDVLGYFTKSKMLQRLKLVRVVRLLRLLKLMRVLRSSRIFKRLEASISISYSIQNLVKFTLTLLLVSHWMACAWVLQAQMTIDEAEENMDDEQVGLPLCGDDDGATICTDQRPKVKITWLDTLDPDVFHSPFAKYTAAFYWALVTITSVGYGDICPENPSEMRWCVVLILLGAFLWAYIIGSICGVIATLDVDTIEHRQRMDQLNMMMDERDFPMPLRRKLRQFFNVSKNMLKEDKYAHLLRRMSPQLKGEVSESKTSWLKGISYLSQTPTEFVILVSNRLGSSLFVPQETIHLTKEGALASVLRGIVSCQGDVKTPGAIWGEDFILSSKALRDQRTCLALTYGELLTLTRPNFYDLLRDFPNEAKIVRKAAIRFAFQKAMFRVAKAMKYMRTPEFEEILSSQEARMRMLVAVTSDHESGNALSPAEVVQSQLGMMKTVSQRETESIAKGLMQACEPPATAPEDAVASPEDETKAESNGHAVPGSPLAVSEMTSPVPKVPDGGLLPPLRPTSPLANARGPIGVGSQRDIFGAGGAESDKVLTRRIDGLEAKLDEVLNFLKCSGR